jgi:hypothetical protein
MTTHAANPRLHFMASSSRQYRQWAAEARRKAEAASDEPTLRQSYLDLAAACDKLADTLEQLPQDRGRDRSPPCPPPSVMSSSLSSNAANDPSGAIRALFFCARWTLATALLNTSAGFARLARKAAPPRRQA